MIYSNAVRTMILTAFFFAAPYAIAAEYKGYECTQDCSGHRAGYAWAEKKGVTDKSQCGGRSQSFIEGCLSRVEELQQPDDAPEPSDDMQED